MNDLIGVTICPICQEFEIPDDFYYCRNGKAIDCTRVSHEPTMRQTIDIKEGPDGLFKIIEGEIELEDFPTTRVYGKPPFKYLQAYPKITDYHSSTYASYEFGVDGHRWTETHRCPKCKKEWSFDNSDF